MSGTRPMEILRHLEQSAFAPGPEAAGDGELLDSFVRRRDQAAFAVLVRRHGPMVLSVCRRVTNHPQDAEDAFQAVFLVLARRAATIRTPGLLGNWLYGVAVRVAQKARRTAARRRAREVQVVDIPEPFVPPLDPPADIGPALHQELARLPAWYRDAIVLCDLRGVSRTDAAKTLGIPEGTLSSRLAGGRKKLADRLARRGVALSAVAVSLVLAEGRAASLPDSLVSKTCGLVADWSAGAAVPGTITRLAQGSFSVRQSLLFGILTFALAAAGVVIAANPTAPPKADDPPQAPELAALAPNPQEAPQPVVAPDPETVAPAPGLVMTPRMQNATDLPVGLLSTPGLAWRADGKALAVRGFTSSKNAKDGNQGVMVLSDTPAGGFKKRWVELPAQAQLVGFDPLGRLITDLREYDLVSGFHRLTYWAEQLPPPPPPGAPPMMGGMPPVVATPILVAVRTVNLDADQTHGYGFAPDGKTFRTVYYETAPPGQFHKVEVREVDSFTGRTLKTVLKLDGEYEGVGLAPDGSRLATYAREEVHCWNLHQPDKKPWLLTCRQRAYRAVYKNQPAIQFSSDGRRLLLLRVGTRPEVADAVAGEWLAELEAEAGMSAQGSECCFTADGRLLALTGDGYYSRENNGWNRAPFLRVWDTTTGKAIKSWNQSATAGFSPKAPVLAIVETTGPDTSRLGLWDFSTAVQKDK